LLHLCSFLKDLISGAKKYVKSGQLHHLVVPQYDGLSIQCILTKVGDNPDFVLHMPIVREMQKVGKQWIINVAYTIIGDQFAEWVMNMVTERNLKVQREGNKMINIDPEIKAAWQQSTHISCKSPASPQKS